MQSDEELMRAARVRAEEKLGFYAHFSAYIIVNALLVLVWWFGGDGYPWFIFPLGIWGIFVAIHAVRVFVGGAGVTDRMAQREYERLKRGKG